MRRISFDFICPHIPISLTDFESLYFASGQIILIYPTNSKKKNHAPEYNQNLVVLNSFTRTMHAEKRANDLNLRQDTTTIVNFHPNGEKPIV